MKEEIKETLDNMKVIDLLNKIANGEEPPKKIKYQDEEYILNKICLEDNKTHIDYYLKGRELLLFEDIINIVLTLNEEVEIIEEDKKIEKAEYQTSQIPPWFRNEELIKVINNNFELQTKAIRLLIDEINKLKEKE